jgi:hypothetical protein
MLRLEKMGLPPDVAGTLEALEVITVEDLLAIAAQEGERDALRAAVGWSRSELEHWVALGSKLVAEVPRRKRLAFGAL